MLTTTIGFSFLLDSTSDQFLTEEDPSRIEQLDAYWDALSQTVKDGNFEGYESLYHPDAVIVFAVGQNKTSVPISKAMENWKQGFLDTQSGKVSANVEFRFSQRIGNETTAHETGIFHYQSKNSDGELTADSYIHFEMLFVKMNGQWLSTMEYQKSQATKEEWDALN